MYVYIYISIYIARSALASSGTAGCVKLDLRWCMVDRYRHRTPSEGSKRSRGAMINHEHLKGAYPHLAPISRKVVPPQQPSLPLGAAEQGDRHQPHHPGTSGGSGANGSDRGVGGDGVPSLPQSKRALAAATGLIPLHIRQTRQQVPRALESKEPKECDLLQGSGAVVLPDAPPAAVAANTTCSSECIGSNGRSRGRNNPEAPRPLSRERSRCAASMEDFHRAILLLNCMTERLSGQRNDRWQMAFTGDQCYGGEAAWKWSSVPLHPISILTDGATVLIVDFNGTARHRNYHDIITAQWKIKAAEEKKRSMKRMVVDSRPALPNDARLIDGGPPRADIVGWWALSDVKRQQGGKKAAVPLSSARAVLFGPSSSAMTTDNLADLLYNAASSVGPGTLRLAYGDPLLLAFGFAAPDTTAAAAMRGDEFKMASTPASQCLLQDLCHCCLPSVLEEAYPNGGVTLRGCWIDDSTEDGRAVRPLLYRRDGSSDGEVSALLRRVLPPSNRAAVLDSLSLPPLELRLSPFMLQFIESPSTSSPLASPSNPAGIAGSGKANHPPTDANASHAAAKPSTCTVSSQQKDPNSVAKYPVYVAPLYPSGAPEPFVAEGETEMSRETLLSRCNHFCQSVTILTPVGQVELAREDTAAGQQQSDPTTSQGSGGVITIKDIKMCLLRSAVGRSLRLRSGEIDFVYAPGTPVLEDAHVMRAAHAVLRLIRRGEERMEVARKPQ